MFFKARPPNSHKIRRVGEWARVDGGDSRVPSPPLRPIFVVAKVAEAAKHVNFVPSGRGEPKYAPPSFHYFAAVDVVYRRFAPPKEPALRRSAAIYQTTHTK